MQWYTAHVVVGVFFRDGVQDHFPAYYEFIVCRAASPGEVEEFVTKRYASDAGVNDPSLTWEGRPARMKVVGIRRIVLSDDPSAPPSHGTELTYELLDFNSLNDLNSFAAGETVRADIVADPQP